ncbi:hypothetical protein GH714_038929 [Hevea brasiliensis]|uniref:Uncharacterized protein n=1 Tax=Hevea brasiliensis TaxID=3981 RepID=A0A6A6KQZ8_HEVBR|nr:hypothetical protein GH714_038929 [Hevea brasiliensis]
MVMNRGDLLFSPGQQFCDTKLAKTELGGAQPISKRGDERGKRKRKAHQGRKVDGSRIKSVNDGGSNSVKQIDLHAGQGKNEGDLDDGLVNEPEFDVGQCDNEEPVLGTFDGLDSLNLEKGNQNYCNYDFDSYIQENLGNSEVGYFNDDLERENEDVENVVDNDGGLGQEEAVGVDNDGDNLERENEDVENVVDNDGGLEQEEVVGVDNDGELELVDEEYNMETGDEDVQTVLQEIRDGPGGVDQGAVVKGFIVRVQILM